MEQSGEYFLHEQQSNLNNSKELKIVIGYLQGKGDKIPNQPKARISAYLKFLREYVNDGLLTGDIESIERQSEYSSIAQNKKNADDFVRFEAEIARNIGIVIDPTSVSDDKKMELLSIKHLDQKGQLIEWLSYLNSEEAGYPDWFKYYVFNSLKKLTKFNEDRQAFGSRSANSFDLFPELDRESLASVYTVLKQRLNGESIDIPNIPPEAKQAIVKASESGNFAKIYNAVSMFGLTISPELRSSLDGEWARYPMSHKRQDSKKLATDISKYRTGWCTAGSETAHNQLSKGDFYVYYTPDEDGNKVPRVAIRLAGGVVAEVRGINPHQHMEPELSDKLSEKLKTLPGGEAYTKKAKDMEMLTFIEKKIQQDPHTNLTREELRFIYEIDSKIQSFGYTEDPRIQEIITTRDKKADLTLVFNCKPEQISLTQKEALSGTDADNPIIFHYGNLRLHHLTSTEGLILPKNIGGNLRLHRLTSAEGLVLPKNIGGNLDLSSLTSAEGLILPKNIGGNLDLSSLTSAEGLILPESIEGDLRLHYLTSAEGLILPKSIGGGLYLSSLTSTEGLILPESIGGGLDLSSLTSAEGLVLPKNIGGNLDLSSLTSAEGLILPESIEGDLRLHYLTSAEGLILPESIGGGLYLSSLTSTEGLALPESIGGNLDLFSLTSTEGLILPKSIGGGLYLSSLTSAEGLILPKSIGGDLYLSSLTSAEKDNIRQKYPHFTIV